MLQSLDDYQQTAALAKFSFRGRKESLDQPTGKKADDQLSSKIDSSEKKTYQHIKSLFTPALNPADADQGQNVQPTPCFGFPSPNITFGRSGPSRPKGDCGFEDKRSERLHYEESSVRIKNSFEWAQTTPSVIPPPRDSAECPKPTGKVAPDRKAVDPFKGLQHFDDLVTPPFIASLDSKGNFSCPNILLNQHKRLISSNPKLIGDKTPSLKVESGGQRPTSLLITNPSPSAFLRGNMFRSKQSDDPDKDPLFGS